MLGNRIGHLCICQQGGGHGAAGQRWRDAIDANGRRQFSGEGNGQPLYRALGGGNRRVIGKARPGRDGRKQHHRTTPRRQRILRGLNGKRSAHRIQAKGREHIGLGHAFQGLQRNGADAIGQPRQGAASGGDRATQGSEVFHISGDCLAAWDFGGKRGQPGGIARHQNRALPARRDAPRQSRPHRPRCAQNQN